MILIIPELKRQLKLLLKLKSKAVVWRRTSLGGRITKEQAAVHVLHRVRIACNAERCDSDRNVCLSIRCFVQTNEHTIMRSSVSGRTITLVSGEVNLSGYSQGSPQRGVKVKCPYR